MICFFDKLTFLISLIHFSLFINCPQMYLYFDIASATIFCFILARYVVVIRFQSHPFFLPFLDHGNALWTRKGKMKACLNILV